MGTGVRNRTGGRHGTGVRHGRGFVVARGVAMTQTSAPVRLTRRGRVVLLSLLLAFAAVVVVVLAPASGAADPAGDCAGSRRGASGAAAEPSCGAPVVVVRPGDTLWSVAERHRPAGNAFAVIEEIRRLNNLPDYTVHPGQRLIMP